MKKGILLISAIIMSSAIGLYGKKISYMIYERPSVKTVEFSVSLGSDYSAPLYKKSKAHVYLSIYKFSNNNSEIVWEGTVDKGNIKNYPSASDPLYRKVTIHNVYESRETLVASYKVIYNSKESELSYEDGIILSKEMKSDILNIKI
ncbi:MAG: hypothetical protein JWQ09_141 [Segetibacter sp.]|nr:hypothetical protein [Segetibacter sp.]